MQYWPTLDDESNSGIARFLRVVSRLRSDDVREMDNLKTKYIVGRLRTDRTAPASATDVQEPDKLYDVVRTSTYEYVLIDVSGTLKWSRKAVSVVW